MSRGGFLRFSLLLISLSILFLPTFATGATITSTTIGNWNTPGTWVGGVVPSSTDDVIIGVGDTVTVTAIDTCKSVAFSSTNSGTATGYLVIKTGCRLNVASSVNATDILCQSKIRVPMLPRVPGLPSATR